MSKNIVQQFQGLVLDGISAILQDINSFMLAEPVQIIFHSNINLPPEITALGGKIEYWESEASNEYYLVFQGNHATNHIHELILKEEDTSFYMINVGHNQHILKVTGNHMELLTGLDQIPENVHKRLMTLAAENILHALPLPTGN